MRPYEQEISKEYLSVTIKNTTGGIERVASEMGITSRAIQKALSSSKSTRLMTLVKLGLKLAELNGVKTDSVGELIGVDRLNDMKASSFTWSNIG